MPSVKGQEWYQADDVAESTTINASRAVGSSSTAAKEAVLEAITPVEDRRILEIACGTGRFTVMLAEAGADVVGLDISAAMLQQGRSKSQNAELSGTLEFLRGDAGRLPFPDDHFDTVIAMRFSTSRTIRRRFAGDAPRLARTDRLRHVQPIQRPKRLQLGVADGIATLLESEVSTLLAKTDLTLVDVEDDFLVPYGAYRSIPNSLASPIRTLDTVVGGTRLRTTLRPSPTGTLGFGD